MKPAKCDHNWNVYWVEQVCSKCHAKIPICNHSSDEPCNCGVEIRAAMDAQGITVAELYARNNNFLRA